MASIFMVEVQAKQEISMKQAARGALLLYTTGHNTSGPTKITVKHV
jgi:hypothetical protein